MKVINDKITLMIEDYLFNNDYVHGRKYPDKDIVDAFVFHTHRVIKGVSLERGGQPQDLLFVKWKAPNCVDVFIIRDDKLERIERDNCKIHKL